MTFQSYLTIDGLPCIDPGPLHDDNKAIGAPLEFWGRANSFTCEIGREPGVAWILVPRSTHATVANAQGLNALHTIAWNDGVATTSFAKLVLCNATCVAMDGDFLGAYLLELRDVRQVLKKSGGITFIYNFSESMPEGTYTALRRYETATLNAGVAWTWQTMFTSLWAGLPAVAGTAPTLPFTLPHAPETWRFRGETAWEAVNMVLDALQSAIVCDPYSGVLTVVVLGTTQPNLVAQQQAQLDNRVLDWRATNNLARAHKPETVRVLFRARVRTANTVEQLDFNWQQWGKVDTASTIVGAEAGRIVKVVSDLYDEREFDASTGLSATLNQAELNTTAAAITARLALRYTVSGEHIRTEHPGIVTAISLGTQIHRIVWRDYGDEDGTRTELWGLPKWGQATEGFTVRDIQTVRMAIVRLTQATWAASASTGWAYMENCKVVRYFVSGNTYDENSANEPNVTVWHPTGYAGNLGTYGTQVRALHLSTGLWPAKHGNRDDVWVAYNKLSERWELLAPYEDHWRFKLIDCVPKGGSGTAYLRLATGGQWTTTTLIFTVYDSLEMGPLYKDSLGVAKRFGDSAVFEVLVAHDKPLFADAIVNQDLCGGELNVAVTWSTYMPTCEGFSPSKVTNPFWHKGPSGSIIRMYRKQCVTGSSSAGICGTEEWIIDEIKAREVCVTVGIENRTSCLAGAGLRISGEWCPADEPIKACKIVEYIDCDNPLPACDQAWVFAPLYACCGQAGPSSPPPGFAPTSSPPGASDRGPTRGPNSRMIKRKRGKVGVDPPTPTSALSGSSSPIGETDGPRRGPGGRFVKRKRGKK